uniref:iron-containing alcohol dehydrogenase n=1 Tax=uncultured Maritalea sp. TaxID=757249 RepID=UPI0026368791
MTRPLLVADPGLLGLPPHTEVERVLVNAGYSVAVFSDLQPNPVGDNIADGVAVFSAGKHDGVIALGGGSAIDAAKAIAFQSGQTQDLWSFEDEGDNFVNANSAKISPIVALPTTSGTGSEVGRVAVIANEVERRKVLIFHPKMMPEIVILDPQLTVGLPPTITAATGMDALAHCLEAYCAVGFHPMADGIAVQGMQLIKQWLPIAFREGGHIEARGHMQVAATMGATAFQKGLGAIHALSHPVGAIYDSHHGLTNAVFMPYVVAFNKPAISARLPALARALDLPADDENTAFEAVLDWILSLRKLLDIPHTLTDMGLDDQLVDQVCAMA